MTGRADDLVPVVGSVLTVNAESPASAGWAKAGRWAAGAGLLVVGLGTWLVPGAWWATSSYLAGVGLWRWAWAGLRQSGPLRGSGSGADLGEFTGVGDAVHGDL